MDPLCPLAMPVTVVQPGFVIGRSKRGSEATKAGRRVWEGGIPPPTVGIFFANSCMKNNIFSHIKGNY